MNNKAKNIANILLYLILFSFLFFGMWEWMQSPFYIDISEDFNTIVWFRIHCTFEDVFTLLLIIGVLCIFKRKISWIYRPRKIDYILITIMGVFYTLISEYVNIHVSHSWGYSKWMPLIPWLDVGIVPLLQWLILPSVILVITKDHLKAIRKKDQH